MSAETKAAGLRQLEAAWAEISDVLSSILPEEMEAPGVVDSWSVKDLVGHMAFWTGKAADDLKKAAAGRAADIEGPGSAEIGDEWNKREADSRKGRSLADVRAELDSGFREAQEALQGISPETLDLEAAGWTVFVRFGADTFMHYREHAEQIRAWQRQLETTEA